MNELEAENFGLEDLEFEEEEEEVLPEGEQHIIVDEAGADDKSEVDEEAIKVFLGLKVEDMVKVTKPSKFYNEDGIVRRLKDGKILVRFYTYGSMFEEWMDPGDVRKLNEVEVLKGLTGPSQPVTQRDFDEPKDPFRAPSRGRNPTNSFGGDLRNSVQGSHGPRNRRQDRVNRGQTRRDSLGRIVDRSKEEENWNWYKEQRQGNNDRSNRNAFEDSEWAEISGFLEDGPSEHENNQWGRPTSKRQQRRDRKLGESQNNNDWNKFVSLLFKDSPSFLSRRCCLFEVGRVPKQQRLEQVRVACVFTREI